ncbi:hypothetical protein K438DRAFT_2018423 [Mycena galopus ATCC 62051]|nr:hypothetical protein K438DRAFT_2018423 [Mycena galopus ATCC 62051]
MLDRLVTDLVLYILALTDVYTILSASRVNKFFHSITLAKQLWIPIVRDLVTRGLSDFPADEDLSAHSAEALVEEVKRAVAGPHTWFPQSRSGPTIYREVKLEYAVPGGDGSRFARWLPGGRHILFQDSARVGNIEISWLRCWEIDAAQRREVWDITCVGTLQAAAFDFRTGSKLIVSLVLNNGHGFSSILLLEVNLSTGASSYLFQLGPTIVWPWRMRISDDYMAWQGTAGDSIIVLINWLSGEFIAFESTEKSATFELFPGHILLAYPTSRASTPCSLHLYSIASLDHLWRPVSEFNFNDHNIRSSLKGVPSVVLNVAGNNKTSPCTISVEVIGCPVHSETYDLPPRGGDFVPATMLQMIGQQTGTKRYLAIILDSPQGRTPHHSFHNQPWYPSCATQQIVHSRLITHIGHPPFGTLTRFAGAAIVDIVVGTQIVTQNVIQEGSTSSDCTKLGPVVP